MGGFYTVHLLIRYWSKRLRVELLAPRSRRAASAPAAGPDRFMKFADLIRQRLCAVDELHQFKDEIIHLSDTGLQIV